MSKRSYKAWAVVRQARPRLMAVHTTRHKAMGDRFAGERVVSCTVTLDEKNKGRGK